MAKPANYSAFYDWQKEVMPWPYAGPYGERYFGTIASYHCHLALYGDTLARLGSFFIDPHVSPPDALPYIGSERMIPRVAGETTEQYRSRLADAWEAWKWAGTKKSIIDQLALIGYTAEVKADSEWDWDPDKGTKWSRFWVILTGHPFSRDNTWQWDDPGLTWNDGHIWDGLGATSDDLKAIQHVIRQWKPAHTICWHIIVVLDQGAWDAGQPDGTWHIDSNRNPAAVYWPGY